MQCNVANNSFYGHHLMLPDGPFLFSFHKPKIWPHDLSKLYLGVYGTSTPLFWDPFHHVRMLTTTLPVDKAMSFPHFPFSFFTRTGISICSIQLVLQGEFIIVILLWIQCICVSITGKESVMPSCAYLRFPGIFLCGFPCLLPLCTLVTSGSPYEPILLLSLLIYDSTHDLCCLTLCLVLQPHFCNSNVTNIYITQIWIIASMHINCFLNITELTILVDYCNLEIQ